MRIAICDDEEYFLKEFKSILENYYKSLDVYIMTFISPKLLLGKVEGDIDKFDIIFLDIEMDNINGIELAKRIRKLNKDVKIIFLTSHTELAMEGYEVDAFRFLAKPIDREKLYKSLEDINVMLKNDDEKIILEDGQDNYIVKNKDIIYIKAENVYLNICELNNNILIRKKIKDLEEELDKKYFFRTHRSYIINFMNVKSFKDKKIIMVNGDEIPVSRNKINEFKSRLMDFLREFS